MGLRARAVTKTIGNPPSSVLDRVSIDIEDGEFVALTGRSGSGKSTLLYLLSSLDLPSEGTVHADGRDISTLDAATLNRLRNEQIGFVFQFHYLIAELTALENVLLPAHRGGREPARRQAAIDLLSDLGLAGKEARLPRQLSGGEQQRVAVARALVMKPRYLFADEPTGALDTANAERVMSHLRRANREWGTTVVLVTHDAGFASLAQRRIHLVDGKISAQERT